MKKASIDIGSNSVLLLVGDLSKKLVVLEDESRITFLGKDLDKNGKFLESSMSSTYEALSDYLKILKNHNISASDCIVTATEASRVATNASDFYGRVKSELGFDVEIISGEEEAYYTAKGVSLDIKNNNFVIMDIGGASTELIKVQKDPFKIISSISLPIGAVRSTDWLESCKFDEQFNDIKKKFKEIVDYKTDLLVCVAGCMTSIGAMYKGLDSFDANIVNGTLISNDDFLNFVNKYDKYNPDTLLAEFPFLGKRAKVMKGGAETAKSILKELDVRNIEISTYGLRFGTLVR